MDDFFTISIHIEEMTPIFRFIQKTNFTSKNIGTVPRKELSANYRGYLVPVVPVPPCTVEEFVISDPYFFQKMDVLDNV